ncbi:hypothetical protein [Phytohabitans houttuyneae]|uniref:hypothetical protein n=1 Tax=Phytohabitans houttuyneae TaxID=1076126 RepID=UPI0015644778|nr:hypothetical protein [Phytohabitans houttuyneae]
MDQDFVGRRLAGMRRLAADEANRVSGIGVERPDQLLPWEVVMLILFVVLMVLWLILAIVGIAIDGLLWLGIVGIILFLGTAAVGGLRRRALRH